MSSALQHPSKVASWMAVAAIVAAIGLLLSTRLTGASPEPQLIDDESLAAIRGLANGDAEQLDALADGVVTPAEHAFALAAWASCAENAGATALVDPGRGLRRGQITLMFPPQDALAVEESPRANHELASLCRGRHFDAVDTAWALQVPVLTGDAADRQAISLLECVASGGVSGAAVPDSGTWDGSRSIDIDINEFGAYAQCARAEEESSGALSPAPR